MKTIRSLKQIYWVLGCTVLLGVSSLFGFAQSTSVKEINKMVIADKSNSQQLTYIFSFNIFKLINKND